MDNNDFKLFQNISKYFNIYFIFICNSIDLLKHGHLPNPKKFQNLLLFYYHL